MEPQEPGSFEPIITDASTNTEVTAEEKIASFKRSMFEAMSKLNISTLSNVNAMLLFMNRIKEHVDNHKLLALQQAPDEATREAIRYNFNIDILIEDCYASVDAMETMRRDLTEGMSLQPLFEAAIALSASALTLADTLVTGLEIRDNPNLQPTEPEAQVQADDTQAS